MFSNLISSRRANSAAQCEKNVKQFNQPRHSDVAFYPSILTSSLQRALVTAPLVSSYASSPFHLKASFASFHTSHFLYAEWDAIPHTVLNMPSLSPTMTEGSIIQWFKKEGESVEAGDALAEVETDKATVTYDSPEDGYLAKIIIPQGATSIAVNMPIAVVVEKKDHITNFSNYKCQDTSAVPTSTPSTPAPTPPTPAPTPSPATTSAPSPDVSRLATSPYARYYAKSHDISIESLQGSGPNGRIIARDVVQALERASPSAEILPQPPADTYVDLPMSNIRRITAQRLLQSKTTIPHYYLVQECIMDQLLALREQLNKLSQGEYKLSINDLILKAAALTLRRVPVVNSEWRGDSIRQYNNIDINVAVNTDRGLLTPIVRNADTLGLAAIASRVLSVAVKARENQLALDDLQIGTFTISNLGMFGITQFSAVINPPQAAILAVGAIQTKVVPNPSLSANPLIEPFIGQKTIQVTLSCDHRIVDGAVGAKWLQTFKDYVESPVKLML